MSVMPYYRAYAVGEPCEHLIALRDDLLARRLTFDDGEGNAVGFHCPRCGAGSLYMVIAELDDPPDGYARVGDSPAEVDAHMREQSSPRWHRRREREGWKARQMATPGGPDDDE